MTSGLDDAMIFDSATRSQMLLKQCHSIGIIGFAASWYSTFNDYKLESIDKQGKCSLVLVENHSGGFDLISFKMMLCYGMNRGRWQSIQFKDKLFQGDRIDIQDCWKVLDYLMHLKRNVYAFGIGPDGKKSKQVLIPKSTSLYEMAVQLDLHVGA